eukprot:CAMPEP_0172531334 /NCGR_PEP_ID=MMETSP1067-20121228/4784_1 /TAXON_ID=265564 ORGANISM="Thalassiosira punctigera, Strain Tpunct2005C2" /NCGR_SAMPLE_ID=MMETSP1067 /ASSEMBLY_ACC=CAM_ASM_000444 /LENGTH=751 /DNA_ID=CAMNT_0013315705 /DNA_START=115 /DNA_END=2370 /DNA_ORIENTATION=+
MMSYDDAEGMLQDQGLEVVVIPYRPSPPPRSPPRKGCSPVDEKGRRSPDENAGGTNIIKRLDMVAQQSPASDESKSCEGVELSPPPNHLITPRTQAAMAEATGHRVETATSSHPPPKAKGQPKPSAKPLAEKEDDLGSVKNKKKAGRGQTAVRSQSDTGPKNNGKTKPPPRVRSKSTPAASKKSSSKSRDKDGKQKPGLIQMAKVGYQELCNAIIRPPRSNYSLEALGPEEFVFCGERFVRKDFGVVNERGLLVECSIWKRAHKEEEEEEEEIDVLGVSFEEGEPAQNGSYDDGHGQITLNVDDWDENKEKGQMYLHVPESLEDESLSSSLAEGCWALEDIDEVCRVDSLDDCDEPQRESLGTKKFGHQHSEVAAHTYYQGTIKTRKRRRDPVVIYLHGNSSGRIEVVPQLGHLLSLGVAVVAFDFSGSGRSEGEFVSLGYYEREDLQTVIHHLRASGEVSTIALWGRSMGAATAIMYGSRDPTVSCMILDSSFTDLTRLAEEMVEKGKEQGVNVPNFVVSVALRMIKSSVKSQAGFSIRHISPISHANRCFIPAMFVAGEHDDFISKRHSELLHDKYAGDKNLVVVDGDHNSPRPRFLLQSACLFLQSCMQLPPSSELVVPVGTNLFSPPWTSRTIFNKFGLGKALEKARLEASSFNSDERNWLPINGEQERLRRQRSQPPASISNGGNALKRGEDPPPGLPLGSTRSRSCTDVPSPTAAEILAASQPPDMSERQKEIQSSLFKMLGQQE